MTVGGGGEAPTCLGESMWTFREILVHILGSLLDSQMKLID